MINRILLRIKIVQLLYAYQQNPSKSVSVAEKELFHSLEQTYHLYHLILLLVKDVTFYAEQRIEAAKNKLRPTPEERNPNTRFIDNIFALSCAKNKALNEYATEHKLSWANSPEVIKDIYEIIVASDFYAEYMKKPFVSYKEDRDFWVKILKRSVLESEELLSALEEQSVYWNDDLDIVLSFVIKTIKKFDSSDSQQLLPMFKDNEDKEFASELFTKTILNQAEYKVLIDEYTKNWDLDRIAFMDVVIMQIAICELLNFPTIPVSVTLNEYIEIAKQYSTDRSGNFINGVLDNIVNQLTKENKLIKAKIIK
jgi:N utilization substance protein B